MGLTLRKLFTDFPHLYHQLYPVIFDYAKDFACYNALLEASGAHRVLDLGCGTGLLGYYLEQAGYGYTGVDISPAMLAIARRHVPGGYFIQCDMRDLSSIRLNGWKRDGFFDAVICTGRAFSQLTSDADLHACLQGASNLLRTGGIFACDFIDANRILGRPVQKASEITIVGAREFWRDFLHVRVPGQGVTLHTTCHFQVREDGRILAEFDDAFDHRAFLPSEVAKLFAMEGLTGNFSCRSLPHLPMVFLASASKPEPGGRA